VQHVIRTLADQNTTHVSTINTLVRAIAYFEGVLGWMIAYISRISYLQARAGLGPGPR
jgi:hypothetical protein